MNYEIKNPPEPKKDYNIETQARALVEAQSNKTQAYRKLYPEVDPDTARSEASRLYSNTIIQEQAVEILCNTKGLTLPEIVSSFKDDINATKPYVIKGKVLRARDNGNILQAKLALLKIYGIMKEGGTTTNIQINNITPEQAQVMNEIADRLEEKRLNMLTKYKDYDIDAEVIL